MNREQIKYWMDNLEYHNRFGELSEDDKILLWLARNVYKLTEGMPEEVEKPKKKKKDSIFDNGARLEVVGRAVAPIIEPAQPVARPAPVFRYVNEPLRPLNLQPRELAFGNWIVPAVDIEVEGPDEHLREE